MSLFTLIFLVCFSTNYLYAACETCGCNKKEKSVKTCIKTGKVCDAKCENKKNGTCCKGESKNTSCSKEKTSCSKEKTSCSKEKTSCSKEKTSCNKEKTSCSKEKTSCNKEKTSCSKEKKSEKQSCSKKEVKKCCKSKENNK